jgi:cytochrome P450
VTSSLPDTTQSGTNKVDFLSKAMTLETAADLEYLHWTVMESLRMQSPVASTSFFEFTRDNKIGDINVRKGDVFAI